MINCEHANIGSWGNTCVFNGSCSNQEQGANELMCSEKHEIVWYN